MNSARTSNFQNFDHKQNCNPDIWWPSDIIMCTRKLCDISLCKINFTTSKSTERAGKMFHVTHHNTVSNIWCLALASIVVPFHFIYVRFLYVIWLCYALRREQSRLSFSVNPLETPLDGIHTWWAASQTHSEILSIGMGYVNYLMFLRMLSIK